MVTSLAFASYGIAGAISGLCAGMFGIGGGLVIVPFLAFYLPLVGIPSVWVMHIAVATSLCIILVNSIAASYAHARQGTVWWWLVRYLLPGALLGALGGAFIAGLLPANVLKGVFAVFVLWIAFYLAFLKGKYGPSRPIEPRWSLSGWSFGIGGFSTLLGMGGGSLMVPFLSMYEMPMRNAVGTAAVCSFIIALSGVMGLILSEFTLPTVANYPGVVGFVFLPAMLMMLVPSILGTFLGAFITVRLPTQILQRIFAGFLVLVGAQMFYSALESILH